MILPETASLDINATYKRFAEIDPNKIIQYGLFALMGILLNPHVEYLGQSEEIVLDHLGHGGNVLLNSNHIYQPDSTVLGALVYKHKTFRLMQGNTTIASKPEVFDWPVIGKLIENVPAHPVLSSRHFDSTEKGRELAVKAAEAWNQFNIKYINDGGHAALFAEGGCNKIDKRVVQPLKTGIARIAMGVEDPSRLLIVNIGMAYRYDKMVKGVPITLRPVVVVNEPFSPQGMDQDEILLKTHSQMQEATTKAFTIVESFKRNH